MILDTVKMHSVSSLRIPSRLVYAYLLDTSNNSEVYVHYDDIRYATGISQQTIIDSIKQLVKANRLERIGIGRYLIS